MSDLNDFIRRTTKDVTIDDYVQEAFAGGVLVGSGVLAKVFEAPGYGAHVTYCAINADRYPELRAAVVLYLRKPENYPEDQQAGALDAQAEFVRTLTRRLGVRGIKRKATEEAETLHVDWSIQTPGIDTKVTVGGYKPASCRWIDEPVVIPAQAERVETRRRLVCEDDEADVAPVNHEAASS